MLGGPVAVMTSVTVARIGFGARVVLTHGVEQMKKRFGDTNGYRLIVHPDYASLTGPTPTRTATSSTTRIAAAGMIGRPARKPAMPP